MHRENALTNKTQALTKSMNMDIWIIGTLFQLFMRVLIPKSNFLLPILFVVTLASKRVVLYENMAFSMVAQSAITCSKLTKETLEQGVKYVQS